MPLPAWASHNHPIVRRDLAQWRQHRRNLGWLWLLFILPPLGSPVILLVSFVALAGSASGSFSNIEPEAWNFAITGTLLLVLWSLQAFIGWGLAVFAVVGAASAVSHERETLNWSMLRLTLLDVSHILNAKLIAIFRWLAPATITLLLLRALCIVGLIGFVLVGNKTTFTLNDRDIATLLIMAGTFLPVFIVSALTDILYCCATALLSSTLLRSSAQTLSLAFALLLLLWLFVFLPIQRVTYIVISDFFNIFWRSQTTFVDPYPEYLAMLGAFFIAPIILQLGLAALAYLLARFRTQTLSE